jgi:hypothetical protein
VLDDWHSRLQEDGLFDLLEPYQPVIVGAYPLGVAAPGDRVEIVCRATDLAAFARTLERAFRDRGVDLSIHPGELDGEEAVFAELEVDGVPVEVSAQRQHVHRRLGAASMGIARVLDERGEPARVRLASAVAEGEDWLAAAMSQLGLSRAALEALAGARPQIVRRMSGRRDPGPAASEYVIAIAIGVAAMTAISIATLGRGSSNFTATMFVVEAAVLGGLFGARLGLIASLVPLALIGLIVGGSIAVGTETCSPDCASQGASYTFVAVLVASAAGLVGAIRDRYFPRG